MKKKIFVFYVEDWITEVDENGDVIITDTFCSYDWFIGTKEEFEAYVDKEHDALLNIVFEKGVDSVMELINNNSRTSGFSATQVAIAICNSWNQNIMSPYVYDVLGVLGA